MLIKGLIDFIEEFKQVQSVADNAELPVDIGAIDGFVQGFKEPFEKLIDYQQITGSGFNIFRIFNIGNFEVKTHSSFLANLLNPYGTHSQGALFYESLLAQIKGINIVAYKLTDYSTLQVEMEKITEYGNLDILISNFDQSNPFAICIENKIWADDQPGQLERYNDYLLNSSLSDNYLIVYLTRTGYLPSEYSINIDLRNKLINQGRLVCMSYHKDIYSMLDKTLESLPGNVKYTVKQYMEIIKNI